VTALVLAVVVALAALAQTSTGRRLTADLGIRTSSEGFTNLYFEHPGYVGLPTKLTATGPVRDRVTFGIQNEEHRALDYGWAIQFTPRGRRYTGVTHVQPGQTAIVVRTVTLPCEARRGPRVAASGRRGARATAPRRRLVRLSSRTVRVTVSLAQPNDSIDFLQQCNA
jgi:hypothetical protein